MKRITSILLQTEEDARKYFERTPFLQAFIAGVGVIVFWRGVWEWLDSVQVSPFMSVVIGSLLLGGVGVFLQTFIGNTIIIKNVNQEEKKEKKIFEKIEGEVEGEDITLKQLADKLDELSRKIENK